MKFQSEVPNHLVEISKNIIKNWINSPKTCKEAIKGLHMWILGEHLQKEFFCRQPLPCVTLNPIPQGKSWIGIIFNSAPREHPEEMRLQSLHGVESPENKE